MPAQNISGTLSYCTYFCWQRQECKSFAYDNGTSSCLIYNVTSAEKILSYHARIHYYQKKNYNNIGTCPLNIIYSAFSKYGKYITKIPVPFSECLSACYDDSSCNTINYNMKYQECFTLHTNSINKTAKYIDYPHQVIYVNRTRLLSVPKHQLMSLNTMGCNPGALYKLYFPKNRRDNSLSRSADYTLQWNQYGFSRALYTYTGTSKIQCAAKCLSQTECAAFYHSGDYCSLQALFCGFRKTSTSVVGCV
ncbi:uncharacterized protein LOC106882158 [Octopus bimaculoides]|uniref:uncharacterized protein LOC106882158 n=1 Tax=Octopus bimaculoides TaxID=37653 RepID=UPI00071DA01B|nr:uncharacterized protein LOC106882158 [Octopus bimaculoides]|eukprot:XP_014788216.1 PREDICTED: uncharacterized protein LOC106882158 [Octopus bimaculoides]